MKIVLIDPPLNPPRRSSFIPIGLAYISAVLKKTGYQVKCIDGCNMNWKQFEKNIVEADPDIVGITCWTFNRASVFKSAKIVRKYCPNSKIIIGGQHATLLSEQTLNAANADFLILGEGEETIVELIRSIKKREDFSKVRGIAYRNNDKVIATSPRPFIEDLDAIPSPDYSDFNLDNYVGLTGIGRGRRAAGIITSRGCPYECNYCSSKEFWTRKWRYRSSANILKEIDYLYFELGVRALTIFDDNFTVNKERAIKVCQGIIERKLDLKWISIASVRAVDREILMWMKRAGCYQIQYGVESGSPKILKSINKKQTVEQIRNAFNWTKEVGIEPYAYLFIGAPGETESTVDETISLMREIAPKQGPAGGILWILPGTNIYHLAKSQKIISDDTWILNDNEYFFYTGEHSLEKLKQLQMKLHKGLARNKGFFELLIFLTKQCLKKNKPIYNFYNLLKDIRFRFHRSFQEVERKYL